MSDPTSTTQPKPAVVPSNPSGPLDWRRLVQWLLADGVITAEEAQRTVARCSQAESTQHPLVRLANVGMARADRKSTRLNSSHLVISYAVFCLKKKQKNESAYLPQS